MKGKESSQVRSKKMISRKDACANEKIKSKKECTRNKMKMKCRQYVYFTNIFKK